MNLDYRNISYINKYNTRRLHSAIGNKTPNEVYLKAINNLNNRLLAKLLYALALYREPYSALKNLNPSFGYA